MSNLAQLDDYRPRPVLCHQCRHCLQDFHGLKCAHPQVPVMDLATGERPYAEMTRRYGECKTSGKLFEPKPARIPWLVRLAWRLSKWAKVR